MDHKASGQWPSMADRSAGLEGASTAPRTQHAGSGSAVFYGSNLCGPKQLF